VKQIDDLFSLHIYLSFVVKRCGENGGNKGDLMKIIEDNLVNNLPIFWHMI
jgi:hypothetical protein